MGSFAWKLSLGISRFENVAWRLSRRTFLFGSLVRDPLGYVRLMMFAWDPPRDTFRLGSLDLELPLRFHSRSWDLSLGTFHLVDFRLITFNLESVDVKFSHGLFRLGTSSLTFSLGIFCWGFFAWELSLGNFRLRPPAWGTDSKGWKNQLRDPRDFWGAAP